MSRSRPRGHISRFFTTFIRHRKHNLSKYLSWNCAPNRKKKMNEKPLSIFVFFFCREDAGRRPRLSFCVVAAPYALPVFDIRFRWNWRMQRVFFSLRWKMSKFNFIQKLNQIEPVCFKVIYGWSFCRNGNMLGTDL